MQEPRITITVGANDLPSPLAAAVVLSINADMQYINPIILILSSPLSITISSLVNKLKNCLPKMNNNPPNIRPNENEYNQHKN